MNQDTLNKAITINNIIELLEDEKVAWTATWGADISLALSGIQKHFPISEETYVVICREALEHINVKIAKLHKELERL